MTTVGEKFHIAKQSSENLTRTLDGLERIFNSIIDSDCFGMEPSRKTLALHNQPKGGIETVKGIILKDLSHGTKKKSKNKSKKKSNTRSKKSLRNKSKSRRSR